jgi:hypothetical protein
VEVVVVASAEAPQVVEEVLEVGNLLVSTILLYEKI